VVLSLLISLAYLVIGLFVCLKSRLFRLPYLPPSTSAVLLILKFATGLCLAWLYSEYYHDRATADVFKFFDDSAIMFDAIYEKPSDFFKMLTGIESDSLYFDTYYTKMNYWFQPYNLDYGTFNDTRTIIRINAFLRIFSFGYYPVHLLFWCFMSLLGGVLLYKACIQYFIHWPISLAFSIFLIPSVLCWSSAILKEGIVMLLLGTLFIALRNMFQKKWVFASFLLISFSAISFIYVKVYILLALFPALISWTLVHLRNYKQIAATFVIIHLICICLLLNLHLVFPTLNFLEIISMKQQAIIRLAWYNDSGSLLDVNPLDPNLFSLLRNLPDALFTALFRPFLWNWNGILQWFSALENFALLCLIGISFTHQSKKLNPPTITFIFVCFSFGLILLSVMGLTTPVLGSLVRYRMPALPFIVMGLLLMIDKERFDLTINRIKTYV